MTRVETERRLAATMVALMTLGAAATTARADGTETLGTPSVSIATGTDLIASGVGLVDGQPGTISVDVPAGATVNQVLLYWEGANRATADLTATDTISVEGMAVTGDFIGGDTLYAGSDGANGGYRTVTYRADITSLGLVGPGNNMLDVSGVNFTQENDGAGVLVVFDDGTTPSAIDVRDGNDFAFVNRPAPLNSTVAQTFFFAPSTVVRFADLELMVGSVADDSGTYGFRPSSFEVTVGGVTSVFSDQLNSNDGRFWDTVNLGVAVPAGADQLTVQVFSRDDGVIAPGNLPASLVWLGAGLAVQVPAPDTCWITTGGFHNGGSRNGKKDYTFGGNVGPPPRGSWEVVDHNTGDNFHSNDVHITSCTIVAKTGPGQPGGKKGFRINRADFAGTGRLNGVDGYPFVGWVEDAGEPSGKKGKDRDVFAIIVTDPGSGDVVFTATAELDGGNVQIHPPNGSFN